MVYIMNPYVHAIPANVTSPEMVLQYAYKYHRYDVAQRQMSVDPWGLLCILIKTR